MWPSATFAFIWEETPGMIICPCSLRSHDRWIISKRIAISNNLWPSHDVMNKQNLSMSIEASPATYPPLTMVSQVRVNPHRSDPRKNGNSIQGLLFHSALRRCWGEQ